jgi:type IV secretory pathway VirB10-like protein
MPAFICIIGDTVMTSSTRVFFAGVGTTFVILGVGFGGGLIMANSALKEPTGYQVRAAAPPSPVRVVLPASAEAAQPPLPPQQVAVESAPPKPAKEVQPEQQIQKADTKKAETEARERRKRYAERKAKRVAARARQELQAREANTPVMAFGGDDTRRMGLFGN